MADRQPHSDTGPACGPDPHDLRRSAIRTFVRQGISENVAMKLSGHLTRSVFDRYNIVSPGYLRETARKLDAKPAWQKDKLTTSSPTPGSATPPDLDLHNL